MEATEVQGQISWGWKIAAYLFLAGVGAGAYTVGFVADILGPEWILVSKMGVRMGVPLVLIGILFLAWDLGQPRLFWRTFRKPQTSWIARGSIVLTIFLLLGAFHVAAWIWPFTWLEGAQQLRLTLGAVNVAFAVGAMVYTGILLGASRPIPFWSSSVIPFLFLVSALSTGVMAVTLYASAYGFALNLPVEKQIIPLAQSDIVLILVELLVIFFYLYATHVDVASRNSANLLTRGQLAPRFWGLVVATGLIIPLLFEFLNLTYFAGVGGPAILSASIVIAIPGLVGGLLLRQVILAAGVKMPISFSGASVPLSPET